MTDPLEQVKGLGVRTTAPDLMALRRRTEKARSESRRRVLIAGASLTAAVAVSMVAILMARPDDDRVASTDTANRGPQSTTSVPAEEPTHTTTDLIELRAENGAAISVPIELEGFEASPGGPDSNLLIFREVGEFEDMPLGYVSVHIASDDPDVAQRVHARDAAAVARALGHPPSNVSVLDVGDRAVVAIQPAEVISGEELGFEDRVIDLYMFSPDGTVKVTVATDALDEAAVLDLISQIVT